MKTTKPFVFFMLLLLAGIASSCTDRCETTHTYTMLEGTTFSMMDLRSQVGVHNPKEMNEPGKIYIYGDYLFINERNEGIHIINNQDPENPKVERFLTIPGNVDMAVRNDVLYADSYADLVAFDIRSPQQPQHVHTLENVFQNGGFRVGFDQQQQSVTVFTETEKVEVLNDCEGQAQIFPVGGGWAVRMDMAMAAESANFSASPNNSGGNTGRGGSMARFGINTDRLYALDGGQIYVFNLSQPQQPEKSNQVNSFWDNETIFPHNNHLFLGAGSGMHIYSLADPDEPAHVSTFSHAFACDPVVVQGQYAYVTLRSGNFCVRADNQLDVVDISNLSMPRLVKTHPMHNPHGLGIDGETLFICEADKGLKVFNAADPMKIGDRLIAHYPNMHAYDVIPHNQVLILIGADGLAQYDYSDPDNIRLLSTLTSLSK